MFSFLKLGFPSPISIYGHTCICICISFEFCNFEFDLVQQGQRGCWRQDFWLLLEHEHILQDQQDVVRVDVLVDELQGQVVDLPHHVLLCRVDHVESSGDRLEANCVPGHEADEDLKSPRVDVLDFFRGIFLCLTVFTWMLINRPLSSASGPSSIALNTGLLSKDNIYKYIDTITGLLNKDTINILIQLQGSWKRFMAPLC